MAAPSFFSASGSALAPSDRVVLLSHATRKLLHADGVHLAPRLVDAASHGLPSALLDEHSFIVRRVTSFHAPSTADAAPLQPRELVTL